MRRTFVFLTIAICFLIGLLLAVGINGKVVPPTQVTNTIVSAPIPQQQIVIAKPAKLIIPELNVDAVVEEVGLDEKGRMDVPKDVYNVGWYKDRARPGELGSAAIDGHLDTPTGSPSVFFDLTKLKKGSVINIETQTGEIIEFKVVEGISYKLEEFPADFIFNRKDGKYLNLITCAGAWDKDNKNYSERYVVFAEKAEE